MMNWSVVLIGIASGLFGAILTDLQSFAKARETDPSRKFDWSLALTRWAIGGLSGLIPGLGGAAAIAPPSAVQ